MYKNPYIKITWTDVPESFTPEKIRRVKSHFQEKYKTKFIRIIPKSKSDINNTRLKSLEVSDNILDSEFQKKLMKEFVTENNIGVKWEYLDRLDNRINGEIDKTNINKVKHNKWVIKNVEFSNFLSFGENNSINFETLSGITAVESIPKNFGGKTTATVDLLLFLFFNKTTKTKTNDKIFNTFSGKDAVTVKGEILIDGIEYFIERNITRKMSKNGEYVVKNELIFSKLNDNGELENLSGEQRRETEQYISSAIGTEDDFLSTILTTGKNLEELIESKPTARGQTLTRFLGLDALREKEDVCKGIYNEWARKLVSNTNDTVTLTNDNIRFNKEIEESEENIKTITNNLNQTEIKLKETDKVRESLLSRKNNDIDQELFKINPLLMQKEIDGIILKKNSLSELVKSIIVKEPSSYYKEDDHETHKKTVSNIEFDIKLNDDSIGRNEKIIKQFETGKKCPTCLRDLEKVDHSAEINKIKLEITKSKENNVLNNNKLQELKIKTTEFIKIKEEYDEYEKNKLRKSRYELEFGQKDLELKQKENKLDYYNKNKTKHEENIIIDRDLIVNKTQLETLNAEIRVHNINIEKNKNNIQNLEKSIVININLIETIKKEMELQTTFKTYLSIYGKNGISKVILKNMIPLINFELSRILSDSCYFLLELNINDKNELEFLMIDIESRVVKLLDSGSGYEKTIASLALRSVLTKISTLPKPNIVVMDEAFGKVADENLEMVGEFFMKIKPYFEHIIIIIHNPLMRNWADNVLVISKEDNISRIDTILKNIS